MAGQNRTYDQTVKLHAELLAAFGEGYKMNRNTFNATIMRSFRCGYPQACNVAAGGELLGLWNRAKGKSGGPAGGGEVGWVELLAPRVMA